MRYETSDMHLNNEKGWLFKGKTTKSATTFMQNKPNSPIVQMNVTNLTTMNYTIFNSLTVVKNKPNQTQFSKSQNQPHFSQNPLIYINQSSIINNHLTNLSVEKISLSRIISKYTHIYCIERYILFVWNQSTSVKKMNISIKSIDFQTVPKKHIVHPAEDRDFCLHLTAITKRKPQKEPATLIKEKIELRSIQPISCSFWGYDMTMGIIPFISTWLILAVLICWFAGGQTRIFGHQSIQQEGFPKKYHSPIKIRPPPLTACEFECILSTMYS